MILKHGSDSYAIGTLPHEHNGKQVHGKMMLSDERVYRVEEVLDKGNDLYHPLYNYRICSGSFVQWKILETVRQ